METLELGTEFSLVISRANATKGDGYVINGRFIISGYSARQFGIYRSASLAGREVQARIVAAKERLTGKEQLKSRQGLQYIELLSLVRSEREDLLLMESDVRIGEEEAMRKAFGALKPRSSEDSSSKNDDEQEA